MTRVGGAGTCLGMEKYEISFFLFSGWRKMKYRFFSWVFRLGPRDIVFTRNCFYTEVHTHRTPTAVQQLQHRVYISFCQFLLVQVCAPLPSRTSAGFYPTHNSRRQQPKADSRRIGTDIQHITRPTWRLDSRQNIPPPGSPLSRSNRPLDEVATSGTNSSTSSNTRGIFRGR